MTSTSICSDICISNDFHLSILWKLFHKFNPRPIFCPLMQKRSVFDSWPSSYIFTEHSTVLSVSSFHRNHQKTAIKHNWEWAESGTLRGKLIYLYSLSAGLGGLFFFLLALYKRSLCSPLDSLTNTCFSSTAQRLSCSCLAQRTDVRVCRGGWTWCGDRFSEQSHVWPPALTRRGHPLATITETGQLWKMLVQKWGRKTVNKIQMDSISF